MIHILNGQVQYECPYCDHVGQWYMWSNPRLQELINQDEIVHLEDCFTVKENDA